MKSMTKKEQARQETSEIRDAIKQYWNTGDFICDAKANGIAQAFGVSPTKVRREIRRMAAGLEPESNSPSGDEFFL